MKYIVRSKIKAGGKIRPPGFVIDLGEVNPDLIPSILEPYQEPVPDPDPPAPPAPEPSVPAELLQLEPLPDPILPPVPPQKTALKAPAVHKIKTKKR